MSEGKRLQFALDDLEDARDALRRYRRAMVSNGHVGRSRNKMGQFV